MRFFALTTATADLPEVPDIQESLTAIQKFIKTAWRCWITKQRSIPAWPNLCARWYG